MSLVEVFSDACDYFGVMTGASALLGKGIALRVSSEVFQTTSNTKAEILAMASGLSRVPVGREVICYTDMPCLIPYLNGEKAYFKKKMFAEFALVAAEVERLQRHVTFREVPRKNKIYKRCHCLAQSLAKGVFRSRGKVKTERKPTVAESITRMVNSLSIARVEALRN